MKNKIEFIVSGSQKCGTSSIDLYLREHSEISMPLKGKKELHFFDFEERYFLGEDVYHSNFEWDSEKIRGEVTPIYMYWDSSMSRIHAYNPEIKIIIILRHPVDRAFSHWNMEYRRGKEAEVFERAVEKELYHLQIYGKNFQHRFQSYVSRGFYATQVRRIQRYFPQSQLLVLNYSEFSKSPSETMNRIYDFLGVPVKRIYEMKHVNSGSYNCSMSIETRRLLCQIYSSEVSELERMLGWDLADWSS